MFKSIICRATANQVFYYVGLKYSTPTIACALTNVLPAATFVLAVLFRYIKSPLSSPFSDHNGWHICTVPRMFFPTNHCLFGRQESVAIKTRPGAAKVLGTVVCVGGAMLLSFYRGQTIELGESGIHWKYAEMMRGGSSNGQGTGSSIWGSLCLIISSVAWAAWFVIQVSMLCFSWFRLFPSFSVSNLRLHWLFLQAKVNEKFPAPYTSTALMTFMATIQCGAIAIGVEHRTLAAWSLKSSIRLVGALYAVCSFSNISLYRIKNVWHREFGEETSIEHDDTITVHIELNTHQIYF